MKVLTVSFLFFVCVTFCFGQSREEYNGPFASWADVKKQFGAKGNGKDDDTRAFQQALDNLSNPVTNPNLSRGAYMVVYVPEGVYCISSTLVLEGKIGVSIIGENPAKTIIKWIGRDGNIMLHTNGSAYYKIARLTFDANRHKDIEGIGIHWRKVWNDGKTRSFAALNIEISDNYFVGGCKYGISGGTAGGVDGTGANDSEIAIKRCVFDECKSVGVEIHGYNALDYWIWDCKFIKCDAAVKNTNGNYHIYRSYFTAQWYCDMLNDNGYYTSMRNCYSENSMGLSHDNGSSCNPFKRIFENNTVLGPKKFPLEFYHLGKITLFNNRFQKIQDSTIAYSVYTGGWCPGIYEIMSLNNTFESKNPFWSSQNLKKFAVNDRYAVKAKASSADFLKTMDPLPARKNRRVFEMPAGADARTIQSLINEAAELKGQRPIIHFGVGKFYLDRTLQIPAGCDLQLIGDGLLYASVLVRKNNLGKAALVQVNGPSYITIKDLQIGDEGDKDLYAAVVFSSVDQPQSQAHIDQVYSHADTSLVTERLDYLYVEKNNSFFTAGNALYGGVLTKQGKGTARVCCYGGQFAKLYVSDGARFLAKDCWWEGSPRTPLTLKGSGEVYIDGAMVAPSGADSTPTIRIGDFNGKVTLLNMYIQGSIACNPGRSSLDLLLWNNHFYHKLNAYEYMQTGTGTHMALLGSNTQCFDKREICKDVLSAPDKVQGVPDLNGFLTKMTNFGRTEIPVLFKNLPNNISNIYISRVSIGAAKRGIVFTNNN